MKYLSQTSLQTAVLTTSAMTAHVDNV